MIVFAWGQLRAAPATVYPEFGAPRVEIQTEALGLSATEVERLVAVPLEELLAGTARMETIRSESVPGLSSIEIIFEPGTDPNLARQLVQERLSSVFTLPNVTSPPVILQPLSSTSRAMIIGLSSSELSLIELSVLAQWNIQPKLLGVPGVANVAIWGQRERQLQVQIDPDLLRAHNVSLDQIVSTTGDALWVSTLTFLNASVPGTGGWIESPNQRLGIRHVLPISSPEDLAGVSVDGTTLRLGDLAEIVEGHPPLIGDAFLDTGPGLLIVVEQFPGANTLDVTRGVKEALEELRPGLSGVEIDTTIFGSAIYIENSIDNIGLAVLISALLGVVVLGFLFLEWRAVVISLAAISLSLLAAVLVILQLGETINVMVLAGMVIGIGALIHDAVIDVANIAQRLRQPDGKGPAAPLAEIIAEASQEVRGSVVFATLVVVMAVTPILLLGGISGSFYGPLAVSYVLALGASMLVALTITPVLSMILFSRAPLRRRGPPLEHWLRRGYAIALFPIARQRRVAMAAAAVVIVVGLAVPAFVAKSLIDDGVSVPSFEERDLLIEVETSPGTSPSEMARVMSRAGEELRSLAGVASVAGNLGRAVTGDQVVGTNSGQFWLNLETSADYGSTLRAIQDTLDGYAGLTGNVQPYLEGNIAKVVLRSDESIVVRIFGPELDVLNAKAEEVKQALSGIDGIGDLRIDSQPKELQVEIEVDLIKAQAHGVKPGDVRRAAATIFAGIQVGNLFEQQKVFAVSVWSKPEIRNSLGDLSDVLVDTPEGGHIRVGDVADVRLVSVPTLIKHENVSGYIDILVEASGRSVDSVVGDIETELLEIEFPLEYHPKLLKSDSGGSAEQSRLLELAGAAAIGIFLLLQLSFGSWRLAALAFVSLPAALAGGVLAALAFDDLTSIGSLAGLLAVLGIAARNIILLIAHSQSLERSYGEAMGPELLFWGAQERVVLILATSMAAGLVFLPLVVFGNIAGFEILHPMAVVFLGGLVTTTLLTLFLVPGLYLLFSPKRAEDAEEAQA